VHEQERLDEGRSAFYPHQSRQVPASVLPCAADTSATRHGNALGLCHPAGI